VTIPWIAVAVIAVGLPLVGWWLGGRRFWSRLRPGRVKDPLGHLLREHGLAGADAARVLTAVHQGGRLEDPRLRRAVVDLARLELEPYRNPLMDYPRRRRVMTGLFAVTLAGLAVLMAVQIARGETDFPFGLIGVVGALALFHRHRRVLERAVEANSDVPAGE
jgi:hypothetical protein